MQTRSISGDGTAIATTVANERQFVVVELAESIRVLATCDEPGAIRTGDAVRVSLAADATFGVEPRAQDEARA